MLLSGVMVELGAYGVWRVYGTVFAGPGGIPAADFERALTVLGALTAVVGVILCWYQRHLHGRAREPRGVAVLFIIGALGLARLPPFGTALGKSITEEAVGGPLTVLYVLATAVTAGAVLRVAARVFLGLGPPPGDGDAYGTTGSGERPETRHRLSRIPDSMTAVPAPLLAAAPAVGVAPGFADVVAHAVNEAGSGGVLVASAHWTRAGILLGLASTALAVGLAAVAVTRPGLLAPTRALPLRRLQSGHVGDYVAWPLVGAAVLGALALPGVLGA